jgi:hypothetical protein
MCIVCAHDAYWYCVQENKQIECASESSVFKNYKHKLLKSMSFLLYLKVVKSMEGYKLKMQ